MKVLFATTNPAKIANYVNKLKQYDYDILTLKDIDVNIDVDETGKIPEENAKIKANKYHEASGYITIASDDGLFIEGLDESLQPGPLVRRVNGKRLNDNEMIDYYKNLIHSIGGSAKAYWLHSYNINDGKNSYSFSKKSYFCMKDTPSIKIREGYPLDSLNYLEDFGKYRSEISDDILQQIQKTKYDDIYAFLIQSLNKCIGGGK